MNYTEVYQLNQWEASDRILREDFNRDNANTEAGLLAIGQKLDAAKEQLATKAALAALQAQVDALPFAKLLDITTSEETSQVDIDVSGIDMSQFAYLLIVPRLVTSDELSMYLRINGIEHYYDFSGSSNSGRIADVRCFNVGYHTTLKLFADESGLSVVNDYARDRVNYTECGSMSSNYGSVNKFQTLNFLSNDDDVVINAGSRVIIYGVRL